MNDKKYLLLRIDSQRKSNKVKFIYVLMDRKTSKLKFVHEKKYERMKKKGKC